MQSYVFPGQGGELSEAISAQTSHPLFDIAGEIIGKDTIESCRNGPDDRFQNTHLVQIGLFLTSIISSRDYMSRGYQAGAVAGHSFGEITALTVCEAIDFETGVKLVDARGKIMQEICEERTGAMGYVIGMEATKIDTICQDVYADSQKAYVACLNCPGSVTISGGRLAVEEALTECKEKGAKRAGLLDVCGAFHSPDMAYANYRFGEYLRSVQINEPKIPFYSSVSGGKETNPAIIKELLKKHMVSPVYWETTIRSMMESRISHFVVMEPAPTLRSITRRISRAS